MKRLALAVVIWTVCATAINNGILCLNATYLYWYSGMPWYEWLNYLFLSIFLVIVPVILLFFLDSVHVRRFLRFFLLIMSFTKINKIPDTFVPFTHQLTLMELWQYERFFSFTYLFMEFAAQLICVLILLAQVRGKSFLPIPVRTDRRGISIFRNLRNFLQSPNYREDYRKLANVTVLLLCVLFSGLLATLVVENKEITLTRPEDHEMAIKFWATDPHNVSNETLELLASHNIEMIGWISLDGIARYSKFGIPTYRFLNIPDSVADKTQEEFYAELDAYFDWADAHKDNASKYFRGIVTDNEYFEGLARFNESAYQETIEFSKEVINYAQSRGYEFIICTTLHNIGDAYDGDYDVDIAYHNPFNPPYFENITSMNWMVYRMERAMPYDEPFAYFTYQWATHIQRYARFIEEKYETPEGFWQNKTSMSLGVTSNYFYTYNSDLRGYDASLDEFLMDVKIAHACEIAEIAIFYFPHFLDQWGAEGIERMMDELNTYEEVSFPYKRRATYFGNLKWGVNLNGSVFGLFYSDGFYSSWFNIMALLSYVALIVLLTVFPFFKIEDTSAYGKQGASSSELKRKEEADNHENPKESRADELAIWKYSRWIFLILSLLIFIWVFLVAEIFFFPPEAIYWIGDYWEWLLVEEPGIGAFWTDFISGALYILLGAIVFLGIAFTLKLKQIDRKHMPNE